MKQPNERLVQMHKDAARRCIDNASEIHPQHALLTQEVAVAFADWMKDERFSNPYLTSEKRFAEFMSQYQKP